MSRVKLEGISKSFKEIVAVDDISLTIEEGEFFSLLGPSGCGKTTTLRMIGGFETPTSGSIYLGDRNVSDLPPYKRDVNTVFQSYALFPHLDVSENVAYGLKRRKVANDEITNRVSEMLELVDLAGYGGRKINQLSGGQQQRVALARALVNKPQVLLLDEPLGALDLKLRKQMQLELKRIQSEVGITFIYVTHDQDEAMTMSDRIAIMNAGHLEQIGAPQEMYESPATGFVAGFLGASNLLDGEVAADGRVKLAAGSTIEVPSDRLTGVSGAIKVGVRPEKLHISNRGRSGNSVDATITASTYSGVSTSYSCVTSDGAGILVYVQNLDASSEVLQDGTNVKLAWDPQHTFVIDDSRSMGEDTG